MTLLIGTSLIAAFIAGVAALFAPCCVTVLLPSYFGSIFRTRRKVFLMTFIFFLGILAVFLPLGLGFSAFGQFFSHYHRAIFTIAGLFFLALGVSLLLGKKFMLPVRLHPKLKVNNIPSVFALGAISGIATTCCAPVLAGALALSILPGSIAWGMVYTLAYVLGMVSPLFLLAVALDRSRLTQRFMDATKPVTLRFGAKAVEVGISELISGITFLVIGVLTLAWAMANQTATHSSAQVNINIALTKLQQALRGTMGWIPEYAWAVAFIVLFALIVRRAFRQFGQKENETNNQNHESR